MCPECVAFFERYAAHVINLVEEELDRQPELLGLVWRLGFSIMRCKSLMLRAAAAPVPSLARLTTDALSLAVTPS